MWPRIVDRTHPGRTTSPDKSTHQAEQEAEQAATLPVSKISDFSQRKPQPPANDDPFAGTEQPPGASRKLDGSIEHIHEPDRNASHPQINIFVVGRPRVGKSTFIERAMDLRENPPKSRARKKMSLDGIVYAVHLHEMPMNEINLEHSAGTARPRLAKNESLPPVDGSLFLYDITDAGSVTEIPDMLYAFNRAGIPSMLIACKEDKSSSCRQTDPDFNDQIKRRYRMVEVCSTSAKIPESQKRCISVILRLILRRRKGFTLTLNSDGPQIRATVRSGPAAPVTIEPPLHRNKTHHHSPSDSSILDARGFPPSVAKPGEDSSLSRKLSANVLVPEAETQSASRPSVPNPRSSLDSPSDDANLSPQKRDTRAPLPPELLNGTITSPPDIANAADGQAHNAFLIMEDEPQDESMHGACNPGPLSVPCDPPRNDSGSSFDELAERLLALPMSKQDAKFVPIFLCLYRKFASPGQVLSAITFQFGRVERGDDPQLTRVGEQLRYLQVLAQWTRDYPGDFAHATLKRNIATFVSRLEKSRVFAYAAREISANLELADHDDDAQWDQFDPMDTLPEANESTHSHPGTASSSLRTAKSSSEEHLKSSKPSSGERSSDECPQGSASTSAGSSPFLSSNTSSQSTAPLVSHEEARQEAEKLARIPRTRLSKVHWRQFMDTPDLEIARELTRIEWILYSSIRPRDLVLHVFSTNGAQNSAKGPESVHRMVEHFKRLFCFVANMILLRDKAKHRARMLEKWMKIAWKVRQLNNYDTLGSIVAGTNSTAIHRLILTWGLVPEQIRKDYMRLTMLMGTVRSHGAYRMAWENSFSERIPFLPVYQKDLVSAEAGSRTFVGSQRERVNWRKFEVMGEVVLSMQKSQDRPYKLPKNDDVMKLVLETNVPDEEEDVEDELYERSLQVEPNGASEPSRKKFEWLRR